MCDFTDYFTRADLQKEKLWVNRAKKLQRSGSRRDREYCKAEYKAVFKLVRIAVDRYFKDRKIVRFTNFDFDFREDELVYIADIVGVNNGKRDTFKVEGRINLAKESRFTVS